MQNPPGSANPVSQADVSQTVEHLFRHESGKMVAILTGIFGPEHLTLAEDVVQEALVRALQTWPYYGVPNNPSAWIMRASRNLALDFVRRQKTFREKEPEVIRLIESRSHLVEAHDEQEIADDRLRLMFVCCHPSLPPEMQVALALKTLCGFSVTEISRAFLTTEAATAKRLTRARQKIQEARIAFEIPSGPDLIPRLDGVLHALYLLFNEGYKASAGENLIRKDICDEAIRLGTLLSSHAVGNQPATHALLALMFLNTARMPARLDPDDNLVRLCDQDRSKWDQSLIARGMFELAESASGPIVTIYHLQAGIAACHCAAPDQQSTDWSKILELYDQWIAFDNSPVVALNRAVAVAEVRGPAEGLAAIRTIGDLKSLENYYLLHSVLGELELRMNHCLAAAVHLEKALSLAEIKSERNFLEQKLKSCHPTPQPAAA